MLYSIVKKNTYQDSVNLMLLSKSLSELEEVVQATVMMGTDANKEIMKNSGLFTDEVNGASNNDLCCVIEADKDLSEIISKKIDEFFKNKNEKINGERLDIIHSFSTLDRKMNNANIALMSIPGKYVYKEAMKALDKKLNLMIFSDNVSIEEEKKLKEYARDNNLIVMGPDCGTSIINGVPFAFANNINKGNIGIIGASGTGIQEISTIISNEGLGISHAIGLGGRDLKEEIGGISAKIALDLLENDSNTELIVFVSKPPAKRVMGEIIEKFESLSKPVVACFLGKDNRNNNGVFFEKTLSGAAKTASMVYKLSKFSISRNENPILEGMYCGGTLANEAAIIISDLLNLEENKSHNEGVMLKTNEISIIDLGDDFYTQGKPHPMIDPSIRVDILEEKMKNRKVDIVLLDNVIGYGANEDMASFTSKLSSKYKDTLFISSITGTSLDFQNKDDEKKILEDAGVLVAKNNEEAIKYAIYALNLMKKKNTTYQINVKNNLLNEELNIVNIGLSKFIKAFKENNSRVIQFDWKPVANGNSRLEKMLEDLK